MLEFPDEFCIKLARLPLLTNMNAVSAHSNAKPAYHTLRRRARVRARIDMGHAFNLRSTSAWKKKRSVVGILVLPLLSLIVVNPISFVFADQCLQIEGVLSYRCSPAGRNAQQEMYSFKLIADGGTWNIRMIPFGSERHPIRCAEIGCDGQMLFAYNEQNVELVGNPATNKVPVKLANQGFAMIIPNTIPHPGIFRCEPLWLAYCSSSHFSTNTSGYAQQIWLSAAVSPPPVLNVLQVPAKWDWLDGTRKFLSRVAFYPSRLSSGAPDSPPQTQYPADAPLVTFTVSQSKDVGGIKVPTEMELVRFSEKDPAAKIPFITFSCQATNITVRPPLGDPKPIISVPVIMMDYRFRSETPSVPLFQHLVTNGVWEDKAAVAATRQFALAKRVAAMQSEAIHPTSRNWTFTIIFVAANVLAVAFVIARYRKTNSKKTG